MELLYVWIEDYKNIKKQGFNFSPKHWFDFEYEEDKEGNIIGGTLHHEERNTNYPKDFFGENISNVTAIVGKNGSGKTNLLEIISEFIENKWESKFTFSVWSKKEGKLTVFYCSRDISSKLDFKEINNIQSKLESIYYTGLLQYLPIGNKTINLSTYKALDRISIPKSTEENNSKLLLNIFSTIFNEYQFKEVTNQIEFIISNPQLLGQSLNENIYTPAKLLIKLYRYGGNYFPINKDTITSTSDISERIKYGFYISILENLCERNSITKSKIAYKNIIESYDNTILPIESLKRFVDKFGLESSEHDRKVFNESLTALNNISDFLSSEKFHLYGSLIDKLLYDKNYLDKFSISLQNSKNTRDTIDFIIRLKACLGNLSHLISFQWEGLSYGENEVLKISSRLYSILKNRENNDTQTVLLTIDEGELGYHSEWQRSYVSLITKLITNLFPNRTFQIILTSHSPFLVSDLPKDNIIFLNKKENGECEVKQPEDMTHTFGANIHSLYRNSFFLENGLMGEFAKGKIDSVIHALTDKRKTPKTIIKNKDEYQFIIDQIGEPLLKSRLQKLLNERLNQTLSKEDKFKELENKLTSSLTSSELQEFIQNLNGHANN